MNLDMIALVDKVLNKKWYKIRRKKEKIQQFKSHSDDDVSQKASVC